MFRSTSRLRRLGASLLALGALSASALALGSGTVHAAGGFPGAVYTTSNSISGNSVLVYNRTANGALTYVTSVSTGGLGTGSGLGSQGAVILSDNGAWLFAVNAGDNSVSSFSVQPGGLTLVSTISSEGVTPVSLTFRNGLLYVLNQGDKTISGFTVSKAGALSAIAGSTQSLNAGAATPEEIGFNPAGSVLAVAEKDSGQIDTFTVSGSGVATGPTTFSTGAVGPYGFAFDPAGHAVVSDAAIGAASSYAVNSDGSLSAISTNVADFHAAPCWLVVTQNGKYAYTANAHDGTISSYQIGNDGSLSLLQSTAAGPVSTPLLDLAFSNSNHFLYAIDNGSIIGYSVANNGSLTSLSLSGLTGGAGIAAS
ncbi:MAG TPA: beta-propeller fold lactonase family protein [Chloroflexota bacterium]